ncbi:MAG: protein translocase subunit SecF [Nanoarchaeota archaeon]|nr:protein translocase subunit SecF [Nanoarchaeota archaeon]
MEETQIHQPKQKFSEKFGKFHDKYYKLLLIIPVILFLIGFIYMFSFYQKNNDYIYRDISLTGGTSVTINRAIDMNDLSNAISDKLENVNLREISDLVTKKQIAVIVETKSDAELTRSVLEEYLGYQLDGENSSFEFTGSTLSGSFYRQLLIAVLIAFVLMAIVVFIQFKSFIPSLAVITSAFADIFMTLVVANMIGLQISTAGIVAFLMLIGYSVDTDILLTTKVIKRDEGSLNKRIFDSFKTGITMTLTSLVAVIIALIIVGRFSSILSQIFTIMAIGLGFDIFNTWVTNVSIIKWYAKKHKK